MALEALAIRGELLLEITRPDGSQTEVRATNAVVDGGRQLVAQLLTGVARSPSFFIVAGVSEKETVADLTKLFDPDGLEPVQVTDIVAKGGIIQMKAAFPPAERERLIKEAGLMLACKVGESEVRTLYNRALIKPHQSVTVKDVLTLTWRLAFAPQGA